MFMMNIQLNHQFEPLHHLNHLFEKIAFNSIRPSHPHESCLLIEPDSGDDFTALPVEISKTYELQPSQTSLPVVSCDMSTVRIADTVEGPVFTIRGSVVKKQDGKVAVSVVGPFAYVASHENISTILKALYGMLGISVDRPVFSLSAGPKLVGNLFEKVVQLHASNVLDGGILLLDGSLTAGPLDSPAEAVKKIVESSMRHGVGVCAFSKSTTLTLSGHSILSYTKSKPHPYVVWLKRTDRLRWPVTHGAIYVFHLSPNSFPFRVDVSSRIGDVELLNALLSSDSFVHGYPESLVLAHQFAKLSRLDIISLLAALESSLKIRFAEPFSVRSSLFTPLTHS